MGKRATAPRRRRAGTSARSILAPVERLRRICLALPDTTEKIAWGEPTWRVRGRLFAQLDDHHHGAEHLAVWLPAQIGVQAMLVRANPVRFFVPPYVGPRGWVGVRIDRRPDWAQVAALVRDAHAHVATARAAGRGAPRAAGSASP